MPRACIHPRSMSLTATLQEQPNTLFSWRPQIILPLRALSRRVLSIAG